MRARAAGALAVGIILFPLTTLAQVPPRDRAVANAPAGAGRLRGRVVAADTGAPLRRARVYAVATAIRTNRLTITDAEGRYELANLPAGRYSIAVSKAGYVGLEFGQRRPFEGGRPLEVADGQIVEQIDFALPRGSVIAGRLTDEAGDPVVGAWVQPLRYQYSEGGRRRLLPVATSGWLSNLTNDLGEFRLFGLMPGTYLVSAEPGGGIVSLAQSSAPNGGISSVEDRDGLVKTFFPGTTSFAQAQPVLVNLSEEFQASFSLARGRMSKISGVVRRSDGAAPTGFTVELRSKDTSGAGAEGWSETSVAADGSFNFARVPPGRYLLEVDPPRRGANATQTPESARMELTAGEADVAGLIVTTRPGISVSGRVISPASMLAKISDRSVLRINAASPNPDDSPQGFTSLEGRNGVIEPSGRFVIRNVSGEVLFRPFPLPDNLVLKSVTLNGQDITDKLYDAANADVSGLEIVIVSGAELNGEAKNGRGEPVRDFRALLFPASAQPSELTTRFMHVGSSDPNGRFLLRQLPSGEYLGVAVESLESGQEWDPAFQRRVFPSAVRFAVKEGQTLTIELPFVE